MNAIDQIHDHQLAVVFSNIRCPVERVRFYRANRDGIGREEGRVRRGEPLPSPPSITAKATELRGLFIKRGAQIMRCLPHAGIFGNAKQQ